MVQDTTLKNKVQWTRKTLVKFKLTKVTSDVTNSTRSTAASAKEKSLRTCDVKHSQKAGPWEICDCCFVNLVPKVNVKKKTLPSHRNCQLLGTDWKETNKPTWSQGQTHRHCILTNSVHPMNIAKAHTMITQREIEKKRQSEVCIWIIKVSHTRDWPIKEKKEKV